MSFPDHMNPSLLKENLFYICVCLYTGFSDSSVGKESACNTGNLGSIPGLGISSGEVNGNPLQYSLLENPMDRGAWQATVHGITRVGHNLATKPLPVIPTVKNKARQLDRI